MNQFWRMLVASMLVTSAQAASIGVANASFESFQPLDLACAGTNCAYNLGPIPGWTTSGTSTSGSLRTGTPANTLYFDTLPDGSIVAFSGGNTIRQVTGAVVQPGVTYTLQVEVGNRKDTGYGQAGTVALVIGADVVVISAPFVAAAEGGWATFTASYTGLATHAGETIGIRLGSTGAQGDFDNVRLADDTVGTVPEPASLGLIGLGVGWMAIRRRANQALRRNSPGVISRRRRNTLVMWD